VDQLAAYNTHTDPLYYTLRFIDGLREDIRSIVLVQRPQDLDTACVLAALQEEVGESYKRREHKKLDAPYSSRSSFRNPLPLPTPPLRDKQLTVPSADDKRPSETARFGSTSDTKCDNPPRKIPYYRLRPIHFGH
jgi:hypothetical protein